MNKAINNYIKFRSDYDPAVYYVLLLLVIIPATAIWRNSIFYIVAILFILALLESFIVKCPYCNNRPVNLLRQFPKECPYCKQVLYVSDR